MLATLRQDIEAAFERDPAARSGLEIVLLYPGLHAVWAHRLAHGLWVRGWRLLARLVSQLARGLTGIEIHPGATLGPGLFIDHGMGVVIGETAEVGRNATLYHGVTLGGTANARGQKRHPTLEDNVTVGAGAKILGAITVGAGSRIGANAVVVKPVPPNSVVVGVPGQVVVRSRPRPAGPDLDHTQLPDTLGAALTAVMARLEALEATVHDHEPAPPTNGQPVNPHLVHTPQGDVWQGQDFQI
jgi:serine O-acetyltransferase